MSDINNWGIEKWSHVWGIIGGVISFLCFAGAIARACILHLFSGDQRVNDARFDSDTLDRQLYLKQRLLQIAGATSGRWLAIAGACFFALYLCYFAWPGNSASSIAVERLKQASAFAGGAVSPPTNFAHRRGSEHEEEWHFYYPASVLDRAGPGFREESEKNYRDWFNVDEKCKFTHVKFHVTSWPWHSYLSGIEVGFTDSHTRCERTLHFTSKETAAWANRLSQGFEDNGFRLAPSPSTTSESGTTSLAN